MQRDLVVIGASAGGIDALRTPVSQLPPDFPASIWVKPTQSNREAPPDTQQSAP